MIVNTGQFAANNSAADNKFKQSDDGQTPEIYRDKKRLNISC